MTDLHVYIDRSSARPFCGLFWDSPLMSVILELLGLTILHVARV